MTTLHLSSRTNTTTSSTSCGHPLLDRVLQDESLSLGQKVDCFSTLKVLIKNLLDPEKSQDVKYRTLKLDNPKLEEKLWHVVYIQDLFFSELGFQPETKRKEKELILTEVPTEFVRHNVLIPLLNSIQTGLESCKISTTTTPPYTPSTATSATKISNDVVSKKPRIETEKLAEKQKARRLLEEHAKIEKIKAQQYRQEQVARLKQDQRTRKEDPNWKPGLSAACAKSGTSISTFRDKYGEN